MKKTILIILFFISSLFAQNITLPLWESNIPNQNEIKVPEKSDTTEIIRISQVDSPSIEVYFPSKNVMTGDAVVICPGGGYRILAYNKEGSDVAKLLNANGIVGIVLKYRLPHTANNIEGRLSPFLDAQRAIRLTRYHADEWGIDKDKIGIMGFSAGGHLASTLSTHYDEDFFTTDEIDSVSARPDYSILIYPVITLQEPYLHKGSRTMLIGENPDPKLIEYYSNHLQINKNTPPTFLLHADDDGGVPVENSIMYYQKLREHNISTEMHIFKNGGHGFGLAIGDNVLSPWKEMCINWIKSTK